MENQMIGDRFIDLFWSSTYSLDDALVEASHKSGDGELPIVTYRVDRDIYKMIVSNVMSENKTMHNLKISWIDSEQPSLSEVLGEIGDNASDSEKEKAALEFIKSSRNISHNDVKLASDLLGKWVVADVISKRVLKKLEEME